MLRLDPSFYPGRTFTILDFYEVKHDSSRFVTALLGRKVEAFFAKNPSLKSMKITSGVLSMEDM